MSSMKARKRARNGGDLALAYLGATNAAEIRLTRVVDQHIARVLDAADDNLSLAADLLGMHRRSLQRYMRRRQPRARSRR